MDEDCKPKVGLALGSGGARGFVHLGVLKVLEEASIRVSAIAGCSMGAIIGALYASGLSVDEIGRLRLGRVLLRTPRPSLSTKGLLSAHPMERFMRSTIGDVQFQDLAIPLAITTLDLNRRERVVLRSGSVAKAVQATVSVPPIFRPVRWDDHELYDAWYIDPVPIDVPFDLGADLVIAVSSDLAGEDKVLDVTGPMLSTLFGRTFRVLGALGVDRWENLLGSASRALDVLAKGPQKYEVSGPYILLQPAFGGMSANAFHREAEIVALGERVARENLAAIMWLIEESKNLLEQH